MKYKYEFEADNDFEKGVCCECPLSYMDYTGLDHDVDIFCALNAQWQECPLQKVMMPYRECYVEYMKSGALYDVYRYTCCGYEHSESRTDAGASEIPLNWCPNCGARVIGTKSRE